MYILCRELLRTHLYELRMRLYILVCNLCRLFHHVSEITCHAQYPFAGAYGTLNEQYFTSCGSPRQTCYDAWSFISLLLVVGICRQSEIFPQMRRLYSGRTLLLESYLLGCHPGQFCNLFFKPTDSGLMRVLVYYAFQGIRGYLELSLLYSVLLQLLWNQVILGDFHLLFGKIT